MHILHCTDHCVQHDRWVGCESSPGVVVPCREGNGGSWASWKLWVWDGLRWFESTNLKANSSIEVWSRWFHGNQTIPFHILSLSILLVVLPTSLWVIFGWFFSGRCRGRHLRGWILQLRCLGRYALYQRCLPQPILPGRLASNDLQWQSRNLIDLLWFIWTNLDEFGGCSTDVLLAPPVILACSIVRYCSSIVCLPLRRLRMMLFDVIRNISWHQEEFVLVRGFLWFLDVSWCFVLPTWEFHRDSPSTPHQRLTNAAPTPHQRLTNAAPTPHQGNRCTTVFGGLIQSQRCTWFAAFHCVPWHRKIAKRSEKESLPYVSSWCFMFHDVSLKIFKIYLCDSCDCDVLWYLIISYN